MEEKNDSLCVSAAVALAKSNVQSIPAMTVIGEVSGFRGPQARSGHCYFQLKDEDAAMDVIVWRWVLERSGIRFKDGSQLEMTGGFDVYEKTGRLSFVVKSISLAGEGLLRQQVAELARKLQSEGLMDESRKRDIPRFCNRVAVVTSLSGSVIDDVKRTLNRRNHLVELQVVGCQVQGPGAPETIIRALKIAASYKPDCILLVRGGGSYEDLMTFNDEALARAVANCPVPVVTGIGHEPDVSICDMVADRRSSTPSTAAESVAPALDEIIAAIQGRKDRMIQAMEGYVQEGAYQCDSLRQRMDRAMEVGLSHKRLAVESLAAHSCLQDPLAPLKNQQESLALSADRLFAAGPKAYQKAKDQQANLAQRMVQAGSRMLDPLEHQLALSQKSLVQMEGTLLLPYKHKISQAAGVLDALSPLKVLERGYSLTYDQDGHVVSSIDQLSEGDTIQVKMNNGLADCKVLELIGDKGADCER